MEQHGFIIEHECPICGKTFVTTSEWVYKRGSGHRVTYLCSYKHMRQWDDEHKRKPGKNESPYKDQIIELLNKGLSQAKVAETLGINVNTVKYHAYKSGAGRRRA